MRLSRRSLAGVGLGLIAGITRAIAAPRKPRPPPGRDPGGFAVAMIGDGLDYLAPDIVQRLARDGEGELIGWDLVDGDRLPYATSGGAATALARIVLAEGQATRLIPVRIPPGPPSGLVPALRFVAPTPARVIGLLPSELSALIPQDRLAEVAANLPRSLIVVGARHLTETEAPRPNVLAVTVTPDAAPTPRQGATADVAIPLTARDASLIVASLIVASLIDASLIVAAARAGAVPEDIAVARLLALAARLVAVRPGLDGAGLKRALLGYAKPLPDPAARSTTYGWIADVARIHRLE